ncbi:hypothetical protein J437_LFUL004019 [Ladona fulva]|uniref:Uncharacterized protein n=1 Tax=Ladona fulva TaxID=123851 RepID=A0A8K0JYZ2_LADFU|nr:hypothetical protein J437_LFUL004019 [Ladona fulva]
MDEKIQCKVLDCDTICQVKSKILDALYKNTPFSLRPSIYELDLAFAELQTDMTDLTADLESSGIPTLDHKNYIMKVVNVASLLMVVLMGKMEYATDVLKSLLLKLIDKSVGTKYPQLMLRRTESVVEKMLTNWMALCMYNYLKEYAGSSLFLLFKAIKHQIEKGPVDAITHDARYSLSEERLLREQIEHGVVNEDLTTKSVGGWKKLNTLAHYGVKESAVMSLIPQQNDRFNTNCKPPCHNCDNSISQIITANGDVESSSNMRVYHLVKPIDDPHYQNNKSERTHKAIPEIFLTRLLSTKGTIQKFVDDFFNTILTANEALPPAVKWLFDLLDDAAGKHSIIDPEVVHAWKSNRHVTISQILEALETDPYCKRMHLAHKLENVACTLAGEETSTC